MVSKLTSDTNLVVDVLKESSLVTVDVANMKVKPNHDFNKREVSINAPFASYEEMQKLFADLSIEPKTTTTQYNGKCVFLWLFFLSYFFLAITFLVS